MLKLTAKPTSICSMNIYSQTAKPCIPKTTTYSSRASQEYLAENTNQFIKKDEWPPQSADCNPMDYAIWDMLSERVYAGRRQKFTETELKQKILEAWQEISLTEIRGCISCWKKRLKLVIEQDICDIEHQL